MSPPIPCPSCGTECESRRICEATTIHECPDCDTRDRPIMLLPLALLELTSYLLIYLADLPMRIARGIHHRVTPA